MHKKNINSFQFKSLSNPNDAGLSRLFMHRNSTRRGVHTEVFNDDEKKERPYPNKLHSSLVAYKYFHSSMSGKKTKPEPKIQSKNSDQLLTHLVPLDIKFSIPKTSERRYPRHRAQKPNISLGMKFILKRQQQIKRHARVKTQRNQDTSQQRLSQIYKKLSHLSVTKKEEEKPSPQFRYRIQETIGKGTFGVVFKATDILTRESLAIKKVLQDNRYKNRELLVMKMLHHPNILELRDYFYVVEGSDEYLNIVVDYYKDDLYHMIQRKFKRGEFLRSVLIKVYAYQLFQALDYLSDMLVAHRDIKPHNILVNPQNNRLVICDFGSAKQLIKSESNLAYICSRCYRAPELIFGSTDYTPQIDMWSVGCVIVEMINGEPPFIGGSQLDQLIEIMRVLGTPSQQQILEMNKDHEIKTDRFPKISRKEWRKILRPKTDKSLVDLVEKIMQYSPQKRLTPSEAMQHEYFNDLRDENMCRQIIRVTGCSNIFTFDQRLPNFSSQQTTQS